MTEPSLSLPFMSVLIRSYNRLPYVSKILEVCMNQTYDKYEIVVLEQSTDGHWEKHREIIEKYNSKINVMLVFIPSIGEFVIPELLCGPETLMVGKIL